MLPSITGQLVRVLATGQVGIVTDDVKLSGPNKGKLTVQLIGVRWQYGYGPEELEVVTLGEAANWNNPPAGP